MLVILILLVVVVIICVLTHKRKQTVKPESPKRERPPENQEKPKPQEKQEKQKADLPDKSEKIKPLITITIGDQLMTREPAEPVVYEPSIPEYQGDYAKAVFLNAYAKASPVKEAEEYQGYLLYGCGIRDCPAYHRQMIEEGYLVESSLENIVRNKRIVDIKPVLAELGLPVSGKKDVLVHRLLENASEDFIREKFPVRTFAISEKGKSFLAEHEAYVYLHKHDRWGVSWKEFDAQKRPGFSTRDVIWGIFNQRIMQSEIFGRFEYTCMYELLVEEGRRKAALNMLLKVVYIDVSGAMVVNSLPYQTAEDIPMLFDIAIMLAPGIVYGIPQYKDVYEDSMVDRLYTWHLPLNVCGKELFLDMIHDLMNGNFDEASFIERLRVPFYEAMTRLLKDK